MRSSAETDEETRSTRIPYVGRRALTEGLSVLYGAFVVVPAIEVGIIPK